MNRDTCQVSDDLSRLRPGSVSFSNWVNEPLLDLRDLLTARDVARLTRRPRWVVYGLSLVGRFPRKRRYHGRAVGWQRVEVLDWLTRGLVAANDDEFDRPERPDRRQVPIGLQPIARQTSLPLECTQSVRVRDRPRQ